tara:strand:+ start:83 stop:943 length:861 start_codon:yes stop_codon:yes gene_type:complete
MANTKLVEEIIKEGHNWEVNNALYTFCYELVKSVRGWTFAQRNSKSVWIYRPNDVFAMGWVGYGEFRHEPKESVDAYVVYSRHVRNEKYSNGTKQFHMTMSVRRDVAMRNAKKYLRPHSPIEVASELKKSARNGASNVEDEARKELSGLEEELFSLRKSKDRMPKIAAELKALLNSGHTFIDESIKDSLQKYFVAAEEYAEKAANRIMDCIVIGETMGKQTFDVVEVRNINDYYGKVGESGVTRYHEDTLPEDLAGKLAVLGMCEPDQYVHDVGVRAAERVFYVAK